MLLPIKRPKREPFEIAKPIIKNSGNLPRIFVFFRKIILLIQARDMNMAPPDLFKFPGPPIRPAREITTVVTGQTDIVTELIGIVVATYSFVCPGGSDPCRVRPGLPMIAKYCIQISARTRPGSAAVS